MANHRKKKFTYFDYLNIALKKYQYILNFLAIISGFTGLIITLSQLISTNIALEQSIYSFKGEQYPILSFKLLDKEYGTFKVDGIIPENMLFQYANVYWHPQIRGKIDNPPIRIHDKIWFLAPLSAYLSYTYNVDSLFKKYPKYNYLRVMVPAVLGINYIKYGESRMIYAIYGVECLIYNKNYDIHSSRKEIEFVGIYLFNYLKPDANVDKELAKRPFLEVLPH